MKSNIFSWGILLLFIVLLAQCTKESGDEGIDKNLKYASTKPGGCNNQNFKELKNTDEGWQDTVIFTIENDTLDIYVGMNYICCAPFESEINIVNDTILITITDLCPAPYQECYCRCMCYYTWDFLFVDFEEKDYNFKIILNDPREENPKIFREGKITILAIK